MECDKQAMKLHIIFNDFQVPIFHQNWQRSYFCGKRYAQQETSNTFIQIYIFLLKYVLQNNTSKSMRTKGIIQVHT